jgi:hypothetical protein
MAASCATCFFGRTYQTVANKTVRVCRQQSPTPVDILSGPATSLWKPVEDDDWCGCGADAATGESFSSFVTGMPKGQVGPQGPQGAATQQVFVGATLPTTGINEGDLGFTDTVDTSTPANPKLTVLNIYRWTSGAWVLCGTLQTSA